MSTPKTSVRSGTITTPPPRPVSDPRNPAPTEPSQSTATNSRVFIRALTHPSAARRGYLIEQSIGTPAMERRVARTENPVQGEGATKKKGAGISAFFLLRRRKNLQLTARLDTARTAQCHRPQ